MLIIRIIYMGVLLRASQLVTINGSTNPLMGTSVSGTWVCVWKGPPTFVTNMDSMAVKPYIFKKLNKTIAKADNNPENKINKKTNKKPLNPEANKTKIQR